MQRQGPTFNYNGVRTLPCYFLGFELAEHMPRLGKAKASILPPNPEYQVPTYAVTEKWLASLSKNPILAQHVVDRWCDHAAKYLHYAQFLDDASRQRIEALHGHTELISIVCDTRLGIDPTVLWRAFHDIFLFEVLQSQYRGDSDRAAKYEDYSSRLTKEIDGLIKNLMEAQVLLRRAVQQIASKINNWTSLPRLHSVELPGETNMPNADANVSRPPAKTFIVYSHKDESLKDQLETHLATLRRQGLIEIWHDRRIGPGDEWKATINDNLDLARIVLLLVSPDFLHSDYCYDVEMKRALERHKDGTARVIPVILRPCDWTNAPFAELQALPKDGQAVTTWSNMDEALVDVAKGIRSRIDSLSA